ncbi:MAG: hypothetical protein O9294_00550 [Cytophagales bacterium]|nr:hypothetical protein [Cytophagales bacterium]
MITPKTSHIENQIGFKEALQFTRAKNQFAQVINPQLNWQGLNDGNFGGSFQFSVQNANDFQILISNRDVNDPTNSGYVIYIENQILKIVFVGSGGSGNGVINAGSIKANQFYRLSWTWYKVSNTEYRLRYKVNNKATTDILTLTYPVSFQPLTRLLIGNNFSFNGTINLNGFLSNLIFWRNVVPTDEQLSQLHASNKIPTPLLPNIVAHYPLNSRPGLKAIDIVDQYNFAKTNPSLPNHFDLINYTPQESGLTNELLQTSSVNLISKVKPSKKFLRFSPGNAYAHIPGYSALNLINGFTLYFEFCVNLAEPSSAIIFSTLNVADEVTIFNNPAIGIRTFINQDNLSVNVGNYTLKKKSIIRYLLIARGYDYLPVYEKATSYYQQNNEPILIGNGNVSPRKLDSFHFLGRAAGDINAVQSGINKCVFINRAVNDYERQLLFQSSFNTKHTTIPDIQFNLNFADVFENGGNYFARDYSVHNRHAQLVNWSPASEPFSFIKDQGHPNAKNALRISSALNQYLQIPFNVPKTNGYTHMLVYKAMSDVWPFNQGLLCKEGVGGLKLIYGEGSNIKAQGAQVAINPKTNSRINCITLTEWHTPNNVDIKNYINGELVENVIAPSASILGWNEISGNLTIGARPGAGQFYNGYLILVAIWSRVLSQKEIVQAYNNMSNGNFKTLRNQLELFLLFDEILVNGGNYTIHDYSPANRTVTLTNYSLAEVTKGNPNYKLIPLNSLI